MGSRSLTFETTIFSHSYAIKLKNQRPWKTALNGSVSAVSRQNETWASAPPCPSCFCLGQVNQSELQTGPLWNCHEISTASTGMTPPVNEAHWSILLACPLLLLFPWEGRSSSSIFTSVSSLQPLASPTPHAHSTQYYRSPWHRAGAWWRVALGRKECFWLGGKFSMLFLLNCNAFVQSNTVSSCYFW